MNHDDDRDPESVVCRDCGATGGDCHCEPEYRDFVSDLNSWLEGLE